MDKNEIKENIADLTEEQLDALYIYLAMNFEAMEETEKAFWSELMQKIDLEFNDY